MAVSGTTVSATDVEGGVALVFTTRTGDVAELRQRVRHMADMYNRHAGGMMMGGPRAGAGGGEHEHGAGGAAAPHEPGAGAGPGPGGMMMGGGMMMPAASASVEDIEGGARLVLIPKDPAQLDALRQHVRARAERMQHGECPMMAPE